MKTLIRFSFFSVFGAIVSLNASALTVSQFNSICESSKAECSKLPVVQSYIGGALDLLATLDERTSYLTKMYCTEPSELFDIAAIVKRMRQYTDEEASLNAMLLLVRYIEENRGC